MLGEGESGGAVGGKDDRLMDMSIALLTVMVSWVCIYVKIYQIVHFKYMQLIVNETSIKLFIERKKKGRQGGAGGMRPTLPPFSSVAKNKATRQEMVLQTQTLTSAPMLLPQEFSSVLIEPCAH